MAAPSKADVLDELKALGVEASEDEKMPELQEKLRDARAAAENNSQEGQGNASDASAPQPPAPQELVSKKGGRELRDNVIVNGKSFDKGQTVSLDKETMALLEKKGLFV